jgi:hypothetical protein
VLADPIQVLVDHLAEALARSVIVDDDDFVPLATSAQTGALDRSRIDAVLRRTTDDRLRRLIAVHGLATARRRVRIAANPELQSLPRLVFPLFDAHRRLGHLWLIDAPPLTPAQVRRAQETADLARDLLSRRAALDGDATHARTDRLLDLVSDDAQARAGAATVLAGRAELGPDGPYAVSVVRSGPAEDAPTDGADLDALADKLRLRLGRDAVLCPVPDDREVLVLTLQQRVQRLVAVTRALSTPPPTLGLRIGVTDLGNVREAVRDARHACDVAELVPRYAGVADWSDLGAHAVLQYVPRTLAEVARICPELPALLGPGTTMYADTLRSYLEHGGQAHRTAAALHVHRSTLYWRLSNIEELLGVDLSDGDQRLRLHLALRLADLVQLSLARVADGRA